MRDETRQDASHARDEIGTLLLGQVLVRRSNRLRGGKSWVGLCILPDCGTDRKKNWMRVTDVYDRNQVVDRVPMHPQSGMRLPVLSHMAGVAYCRHLLQHLPRLPSDVAERLAV